MNWIDHMLGEDSLVRIVLEGRIEERKQSVDRE